MNVVSLQEVLLKLLQPKEIISTIVIPYLQSLIVTFDYGCDRKNKIVSVHKNGDIFDFIEFSYRFLMVYLKELNLLYVLNLNTNTFCKYDFKTWTKCQPPPQNRFDKFNKYV